MWAKYAKRRLRSLLCDLIPLKLPSPTAQYLVETTFAFHRKVVFVQVGAHDGISNDPIAARLQEGDRWSGLSIEPVPSIYETLVSNRGSNNRFKYANVAIGTKSGVAPFYSVVPNGDEEWLSQVSSFSREHVEQHVEGKERCQIVENQISVCTFDEALQNANIFEYDMLAIDAEGHDLIVLRQAASTLNTATLVILESDHLTNAEKSETQNILNAAGFTILSVGGDYIGIKNIPRWIRVGYKDFVLPQT